MTTRALLKRPAKALKSPRGAIVGVLGTVAAVSIILAAFTQGSVHDVALNVLAEVFGIGVLSYVVERLLARQREQELNRQRREAIEDLQFVLMEIEAWLGRLYLESGTSIAWYGENDDFAVPIETLIDYFPKYLGQIDFAAPGSFGRDKYFIEWARRTFNVTVDELARWERNFSGAAGLFGDDFRTGTERVHSFIRAVSSFLEGMERFILREKPSGQVFAYQSDEPITELIDEESAARLVTQLHDFLTFYRGECVRYAANVADLAFVLKML